MQPGRHAPWQFDHGERFAIELPRVENHETSGAATQFM